MWVRQMSKGFALSVFAALSAFGLSGYIAFLLVTSSTNAAAKSMTVPLIILVMLFSCTGLVFAAMAALWRFRPIELEPSAAHEYRFVRADNRSLVEYSSLKVVKLIGDSDDARPTIKYAIVKLDGRYWIAQRLDSDPGIVSWVSAKG